MYSKKEIEKSFLNDSFVNNSNSNLVDGKVGIFILVTIEILNTMLCAKYGEFKMNVFWRLISTIFRVVPRRVTWVLSPYMGFVSSYI